MGLAFCFVCQVYLAPRLHLIENMEELVPDIRQSIRNIARVALRLFPEHKTDLLQPPELLCQRSLCDLRETAKQRTEADTVVLLQTAQDRQHPFSGNDFFKCKEWANAKFGLFHSVLQIDPIFPPSVVSWKILLDTRNKYCTLIGRTCQYFCCHRSIVRKMKKETLYEKGIRNDPRAFSASGRHGRLRIRPRSHGRPDGGA